MEDKIRSIMASVFGIEILKINANTSPDTLEEWDSLRHMSLIVALEEEFDVKFTDDEMVEMLNLPLIKTILKDKRIR